MNRRRCFKAQPVGIAAELHALRKCLQLKLLRAAIRRLIDCILPRTDRSSPPEHVRPPRVIALSSVTTHTENPDVLERERLVGVFHIDVEVGDARNAVSDDLAVLFVGAESGAYFVDRGEDEFHQSLFGNPADVHLEERDVNRGRATEFDPALRMFTSPLAGASLGVFMVVVPAADATAVVAPRVKCWSGATATKTLGGSVHRTEVCSDEVRSDEVPGAQAFSLAENVMTKAPLSLLRPGIQNKVAQPATEKRYEAGRT